MLGVAAAQRQRCARQYGASASVLPPNERSPRRVADICKVHIARQHVVYPVRRAPREHRHVDGGILLSELEKEVDEREAVLVAGRAHGNPALHLMPRLFDEWHRASEGPEHFRAQVQEGVAGGGEARLGPAPLPHMEADTVRETVALSASSRFSHIFQNDGRIVHKFYDIIEYKIEKQIEIYKGEY